MMEDHIVEILKGYPGLILQDGHKFSGFIDVSNEDRYEVEIDFSCFPHRFPFVKETGERIPRKADRHIYQDSGSFCFTTSAKEQILLKKTIKTLPDFFSRILIPFLLNNSYFEINGVYLHGEHPHGVPGILDGYLDILGVSDIRRITALMKARSNGLKIRPNDPCFCGSGLKIKKCGSHFDRYRDFRLIEKTWVQRDYERIVEYFSAVSNQKN